MKMPAATLRLPTAGRLKPPMSADTRFFWEGAAARRLLLQRCSSCGAVRHPPGPACPHCHGLDWDVVESSGRGRVFGYTVIHHPLPPGFSTPFVVVVVELDEGVRMISNLAVDPGQPPPIGAEVEVFFLDQAEGWTVPQFRLVTDPRQGGEREWTTHRRSRP